MTFEKGQTIDGRYAVVFPLSQDNCTETYRVRDNQDRLHFLTLYTHDLLPAEALAILQVYRNILIPG